MKILFRLTLLALAALGAKALYERLRPQIDAAGDTTHRVVDETLKPAFREATASVRNASTHAVHEVAGAAQQAASELQGHGGSTSTRTPAASPAHATDAEAAAVDRSFGEHEPLSAMAEQDLGLEGSGTS
jgi:hypothetical protein